MLSKICTYCNKTFYSIKIDGFAKHFHKAKLGKFGFASACKVCRAEQNKKYNKKRESKAVEKIKTCIVCNTVFNARRWNITVCSTECYKFRNKVLVKMNRNKYDLEAKELAKKEKTRKNKMKPYTKQEEEFIMQNRGEMKLRDIAKKLNRTTRGIILKITQLKAENEK